MFTSFLIKYGEIGVKGKNRYRFEDALIQQIKYALKKCEGSFIVSKNSGRIYVEAETEFDFDEAVEHLQRVFGITAICPVVHIKDNGVEDLCGHVENYMRQVYGNEEKTFKVHARRARKNYPLNSQELDAKLGEVILDAFPNMKVDVHNPEVTLNVEIREKIYLYSQVIPGAMGMPVGTGGKAMLLLSGGIDSPVAGYMIAKRGVKIDAVYFHAPPYTSERALEKVVDLAKIVARYAGPVYLHVINFTDIQLYIYENCPHEELTIIMRRYMMRIAETIAKETECLGLVTGESIGQVASQTMSSLLCTNEVCTLPVYRPLIAFDKEDIVTLAKRIDTYETSILPYEDCCTIFVAKHPVTKPNLGIIKKHERHLEEKMDELVRTALETKQLIIAAEEQGI
ncbi:MAG: tRNA 4-thiouridine(8) synthase ThiI [Lachnospiraceae bacterium]|nr:tRNA 4-thiouridine(8) synthase ThiI [Lachnospiraceae bacterium]